MHKPIPAELSDAAKEDLRSIFNEYEDESLGLGDEFLNDFYIKLNFICLSPEASAIASAHSRKTTLDRFPYILYYYLALEKTIFVFGVFHERRGEKFVKSRLKQS